MSIPVLKKSFKKYLKKFTKYLTNRKLCDKLFFRLSKTNKTRMTQNTKQGEA